MANQTGILLETGTNEVEILEFLIEEEGYRGTYGINVAKVLEIIPFPKNIVRPPNARADFVAGMFNHRDKLVPVLDLARWMGKTRSDQGSPKVLITEFNNVVTGFVVSGVNRIHRVTWGDVRPLDGYMENLSDAVTGTIQLENKIVFMVDLEKAISDLDPTLALSVGIPVLDSVDIETFQPIRILHVDDSAVIRRAVKQRMEENHIFTVQSLESGDQAWAHMVALKQASRDHGGALTDHVEAVLTDIEMPGMDGYHFCKRIKEDIDLKDLPVVLFSSLINEKLTHKGDAVGADGQFTKPDLRLMTFIKELVEKRRSVSS
jgi:two-component system, chemotaxis family, chemotaxis protein CheV